MPNGKHNPQCYNCDSFHGGVLLETRPENRRWCHKHDFVLPYGCGELICADWQYSNKKNEIYSSLEPGFLYYYSYTSPSSPEKLGDFQSLQNLVFTISIHPDDELQWVLYVKKDTYPWFPEPENQLKIYLNKTERIFRIADVQRKLWMGSKRAPSGEWHQEYRTESQRVIYCPGYPKTLYEWLNVYIDMDRLIADIGEHKQTEMLLPLGVSSFVELVEKKSVYMLHYDSLEYSEYRRE